MRSITTRARPIVAALMGLALLAACTDTDLPSTTEPESGSGLVYTLATVDGAPVPRSVAVEQVTVTVTRGKLTLAPDSTWIVSHAITGNAGGGGGSSVTTLRGTYTRNGTALTLNQTGGVGFTGTWSLNDVTLSAVGATIVGTGFTYTR